MTKYFLLSLLLLSNAVVAMDNESKISKEVADAAKKQQELNQQLNDAVRINGGDINKAKSLLEAKAHVNAFDEKIKGTPLLYAAISGNKEMIRLLLDNGADKDFKNQPEQGVPMTAWDFFYEMGGGNPTHCTFNKEISELLKPTTK